MMENDLERLWGRGSIRAFISHGSDDKKFASELASYLRGYRIAVFVAHGGIEPMPEREDEMERALFSMDLLVALLTPEFSASNWTDQEIGIAIGRSVPVVPICLGKNPYGFLDKYQAIHGQVDRPFAADGYGSSGASETAGAIFRFALGSENLGERAVDAYIAALRSSGSFNGSNYLAGYMERITALSPEQEKALVDAFNANSQVAYAWGIRSRITSLLRSVTGNTYGIAEGHQLRKLS